MATKKQNKRNGRKRGVRIHPSLNPNTAHLLEGAAKRDNMHACRRHWGTGQSA